MKVQRLWQENPAIRPSAKDRRSIVILGLDPRTQKALQLAVTAMQISALADA
jgi:hypothetical protein